MGELQPGTFAAATPDRTAVLSDRGESLTYGELEDRTRRLAQAFASMGLGPGDHIAVVPANRPHSLEVLWAAQRSGLYFTPISTRLTPDEAAYVVNDCGARVLAVSASSAELGEGLIELTPGVEHRLALGGPIAGHEDHEAVIAAMPAERLPRELEGIAMTYSSGTTGRPKGVLRPFVEAELGTTNLLAPYFERMGIDHTSVFMVPTPLYHAMPMHWTMALQRIGATCLLMEKFDAERCLELIEEHQVTHGVFVPTMFVRMLKLSDEQRRSHDLSSIRTIIHAGAPCPPEVKRRMIEWWGPRIHEFYGASEGGGATYITSEEWLAHPGSVGVPLAGTPHPCDDDGNELPVGEPGVIWFEDAGTITFHNDAEKSRSVVDDRGWVTFWDIGYVDADGFLYLTDRKQFMIVSGGVNIYPQEVEDVLVVHPEVADCAVFGVPNEEFGEEVKAVVQPANWSDAGPELADRLIEHCRAGLAHFKCPRSIDFEPELPRGENGKLYKRELRDRYWDTTSTSRIV